MLRGIKSFGGLRTISLLLVVCAVAAPFLVVLASGLTPFDEIFVHLITTDFPNVLINTAWLLLGVAVGTTLLGVSLAWLTATFDFPGRSLFDWALILPMAIPTYVLAFVGISLFGRTGPLQNWLRAQGIGNILSPRVGATGGIICVMILALYPYIYLFARNGFYTQGPQGMEVARSLGQRHTFYKVALPMARPFIISGLMLALMETLSDFGAVSIFNYDTLTTTIYKAWFSLFSIDAAAKFSFLLVLLAVVLLLLEKKAQGRRRYTLEKHPAPVAYRVLPKALGITASVYCGFVLLFALIIPVIQLFRMACQGLNCAIDAHYLGFLSRSVFLSTLAAGLVTVSALVLVYVGRSPSATPTTWLIKGATLGYALPGTMLAVGGMIFVAHLDHQLKKILGYTGLIMSGTILAMMLGYLARFLVLAYNSTEAAMRRVTPHMEESGRSLGVSFMRILTKIHIPLIRGGLLTGALLVFVDVMKEMPITLMTRPFGWDTLAVRIFQFTSEGEWEKAALPALTLVLLGFIPVIWLTRQPVFRH